MKIIKLFAYFCLLSLNVIERNSVFCMEEELDSYEIGARYYEGKGVEEDKVEAAKCFLKAAEQGHITAQFRLAVCYDMGEGVSQNKVEAAKYFQKAGEQEHIIAQFRTGVCYEKGEGVKQDKEEALKWFQKAANQGNVPAQQRVIRLNNELLGHSSRENQVISSNKIESDTNKNHANSTNRKVATRDYPINNTSSIASQKHMKHPRQKNQKQNDQKILSPDEFKKAEEAARKAMDQLIAQEEEEIKLRMSKQSRGNSTKVKRKEREKKEEKVGESASAKQITNLKKANEKPSGGKPSQASSTKVSAVGKLSPSTCSPQTQKQDNASKRKQKSQVDNITKTTQASYNNHLLVPTANENETTNTVEKEGNKKEEETREPAQTVQITNLKKVSEKPSSGKPGQISNTEISDVDKLSPITYSPQTQKQDNASKHKQKGHLGNTAQTHQASNNKHILASSENLHEATSTVGKEGSKKEEKPGESASIKQITNLKKAIEKPSGSKPPHVSSMQVSNIDKLSPITYSPQAQKQDNATRRKRKGHLGNIVQSTQALNNNHPSAFLKPQKEATNSVVKKEDKKEEKKYNQNECLVIQGIKEQEKRVGLKEEENKKSMSELLEQTESKTASVDSITANDREKKVVIDANQLLQVDNQPESSSDHQSKPHKQKSPKILWGEVKDTLRREKIENQNEVEKGITKVNNMTTVNSPVLYPTMSELLDQTEPKTDYVSSIASTNDREEKVIVDANQLSQVNNQRKSISDSDPQPKSYKQKSPKILGYKMKEMLRKKKPESQNEWRKKLKAESNTNIMRSPVSYPLITNSTARMKKEPRETPYASGQIRYIQVPVPFPIRVPVYIPVPTTFNPSEDLSKLWVPHTQVKYEDGKKIITQWSNESKGSIHIIHPDSYSTEQEYNHLDKRLRNLKILLKMYGSQIEDQGEKTDSSSPHIIHHGGEAAKQKNDELKKKISYLEQLLTSK